VKDTNPKSEISNLKSFGHERLREFVSRVFVHHGVPADEATKAADVLVTSDLRGIDSHGVARLPWYHEFLGNGRINPRPNVTIVRESPSSATVDGDNGLGLVVGPKANAIALEKAEKVGTGWVSVRNSNHYGIAGYYVLEALRRDAIGWAMTNASSQVAPLWSAQRMMGTNPIAIAFPGLEEPPIVIDMATAVVAYGKIEIARRKGESIPEGWALDSTGKTNTDPNALGPDYALLPLGSDREHGGHKGYCLAAMVDILCAVLSGASWGPFAPGFVSGLVIPQGQVGHGIGHFFGAMKLEAFLDPTEFKRQIDHWIRTFRAARPVPGTSGPLIPGDPEREAEAQRRRDGIPLILPVVESLRQISRETGVPLE
jgi:L-2-hydroxycarboxylate dehydrogenase (NAD+)